MPDRGDVVWITMAPTAAHEQSGRRPALVLTPAAYNGKVGLAILCPITSKVKGYPFEVRIPDGLPVDGVVLSDQAKSLDWRARGAELVCAAAREYRRRPAEAGDARRRVRRAGLALRARRTPGERQAPLQLLEG